MTRVAATFVLTSCVLACSVEGWPGVASSAETDGAGGTLGNIPPECGIAGYGSTLKCADGREGCARLIVPPQPCSFTQHQALAGIDIDYEVQIDEEVVDVTPEPLDRSGCAKPGSSGLIVFEELRSTTGGVEKYCQCDVGSCANPAVETHTLERGTYPLTFHWDGRAWEGPGETNRQLGEPFAPGLYVLNLHAEGTQRVDGDTHVFSMQAGTTIHIDIE